LKQKRGNIDERDKILERKKGRKKSLEREQGKLDMMEDGSDAGQIH
jgi:hypothetical protein